MSLTCSSERSMSTNLKRLYLQTIIILRIDERSYELRSGANIWSQQPKYTNNNNINNNNTMR